MKSVAIIGSGPAGLTAAIYASRANLNVTVYSGRLFGGQLTQTSEIENFPGFIHGINGNELMMNMVEQAKRFGANFDYTSVDSIERIEDKFNVNCDSKTNTYDAVIIATGSSPKYLGIEGEDKWLGYGYHTCATCDGFFYKGKTLAVAGGGDTAMEEASYLSHIANKVYIIHRSENFKASKIMLDRCKSISNIEFLTNRKIVDFLSENNDFKGVMLTHDSIVEKLPIDALFVAIGHTPNTEFVKNILTVDQFGYLKPINRTMSEIDGIFIAGDVGDNYYRQAITSAGDGCKAAIDCERWLAGK